MDFELGPDLELLRRTAHEFMARRATPALVRRMARDDLGYDPAQWREAEALGWGALADGAELGGHVEMVVLAIEAGRTLWPSPLVEHLARGRSEVGALVTAAQLVGIGEAVLELTVGHVTTRRQFGRPLGSFQAVRHRLADMSAELDLARILTYRAAWGRDQGEGSGVDISRAKLAACRAAQAAIMGGHQLHGGVGFAADHPLPLYTLAARRAETAYGDAEFHLDRLEEVLGAER